MAEKKEVKLEPKTDLSAMLLVIVEEIGSIAPMAFKDIDVQNALKQADELVMKL